MFGLNVAFLWCSIFRTSGIPKCQRFSANSLEPRSLLWPSASSSYLWFYLLLFLYFCRYADSPMPHMSSFSFPWSTSSLLHQIPPLIPHLILLPLLYPHSLLPSALLCPSPFHPS